MAYDNNAKFWYMYRPINILHIQHIAIIVVCCCAICCKTKWRVFIRSKKEWGIWSHLSQIALWFLSQQCCLFHIVATYLLVIGCSNGERKRISAVIVHSCPDSSFLSVFCLVFFSSLMSWSCDVRNVFDPECCKQITRIQWPQQQQCSRYEQTHTHAHM